MAKHYFLQTRVSEHEREQILKQIEAEHGKEMSYSNANRLMWKLEPLQPRGAPKGNKNKQGKKKIK